MTRADLPWLGLLAALALAHGLFVALDTRVPGDQIFLFQALPAIRDALGPGGGGWASLLPMLRDSSGWYAMAVVGLLEAVGPSSPLLRVICVVPSWLLVLSVVLTARRLGGPSAATATAGLLGSIPLVVTWGRQVWFHVPEAALITAAMALWVHDPRLARWRTVVALAALGALAMTLRQTGLVWVATLAPLALGAARARVAALFVAWGLAALLPLSHYGDYLGGKLLARSRYAEAVPALVDQIPFMVGWGALALGAAGLVALLRRRESVSIGILGVLVLWGTLPLALVGVFQAGLDNHTLFAVGLGLGGGLGLARLHRLGPWAAVGLFLAFHGLAYTDGGLRRVTAGRLAPQRAEPIVDLNRPYRGFGEPDLRALFAATCPEGEGCFILVHRGLFRPFQDTTGALELYLMGEERVRLVPLHLRRPQGLVRGPAHAMASMRCSPSERLRAWQALRPDSDARAQTVIEERGFVKVWERPVTSDCALEWWAPPEGLPNPGALP
ncbi:MAG: hypothetical protein H6739_26305 [Alphaproteobacteria bacterium]|nr:hypothetical protein [Alphaproteobacteria bacterium]